jgi:hypothetical protein
MYIGGTIGLTREVPRTSPEFAMPARIPTPTKKRIAKLAEEGFSQVEIARELNINRRTVASYIEGVAGPAPKQPVLTPEMIGKLQFVLDAVKTGICPECATAMYFYAEQRQVICPDCRQTWQVVPGQSAAKTTTTTASRTYQTHAAGTLASRRA